MENISVVYLTIREYKRCFNHQRFAASTERARVHTLLMHPQIVEIKRFFFFLQKQQFEMRFFLTSAIPACD